MNSSLTPTAAGVITAGGAAVRQVTGLRALSPESSLSVPAATCRCVPGDNLAPHRLLADDPAGSVLVCDAGGRADSGHFGELMALDALNRGLAGLVIDGAIRDGAALLTLGFPVLHRGFAPAPCAKSEAPSVAEPIELAGARVAQGDMVVADCDGVVVVPEAEWQEVEARVRAHEADEAALRTAVGRGERLAELIGLGLEDEGAA